MSLGLQAAEFWAATPREVSAIVAGVRDREHRHDEQAQAKIYLQAVLNRAAFLAEKFPSYDEVFKHHRLQTDAEMVATLQDWVAATKKGEA